MSLSEKREEYLFDWKYNEKDVKEFIRKLKDSFNDDRITPEYVLEKIDKLAGKELLE